MARVTFDSTEYYRAKNNFDGYCLGCGAKIGFSRSMMFFKNGNLRHNVPIKMMVCNAECERVFIRKTIKAWPWVRDEVLKRDNFTCQDCHKTDQEIYPAPRFQEKRPEDTPGQLQYRGMFTESEKNNIDELYSSLGNPPTQWEQIYIDAPISLEVHHKIPISEGGPEFDMENCITLCHDCHVGPNGRHSRNSKISRAHVTLDKFAARTPQACDKLATNERSTSLL